MIFTWLIFIEFDVWRNWFIIEKEQRRPNYLNSFFIRLGLAILYLSIMVLYDDFLVKSIYHIISVVVFIPTSFWVIFDPSLNIIRGKRGFFYKGENSGWLDKIKVNPYILYKVLSLILAIISVIYYL